MIKSWEELGEVLAQFENRISYLENSQTTSMPEEGPKVIEHIHRHSDMSRKDFGLLQQMVLKVDYLEKRLNEIKPRKQTRKYTIRA